MSQFLFGISFGAPGPTHGRSIWTDQEKGNTMLGYYVDQGNGMVCSTAMAPSGCHFEFKDKEGFNEVWIVADRDGEVLQEMVFWPSLEELAAGGVDVTGVQ